ncbi:MAG: TonB-dependent receptor [Candidatus Latescibacteria bacterium]|jgi:outer membrane receptor protein involved in Fe transport|nr:TonB-dependent receptor [Candidatus Latescibacterota bacterium]
MDNDVVDVDLEHVFAFSRQNHLVVGGSYRRSVIRSNVYLSDRISQDIWSLFFESAWRPGEHVSVVTSARLDRHPLTRWVFSPRGSLVFSPNPRHTLRLSAGGSFRNPTVTEGYLRLYTYVPTPFELPLEVEVIGNTDLDPERMTMVEAAYNAEIPPLKLSAAAYRYRLKDVVSVFSADPFITLGDDPKISVPTAYTNLDEETRS